MHTARNLFIVLFLLAFDISINLYAQPSGYRLWTGSNRVSINAGLIDIADDGNQITLFNKEKGTFTTNKSNLSDQDKRFIESQHAVLKERGREKFMLRAAAFAYFSDDSEEILRLVSAIYLRMEELKLPPEYFIYGNVHKSLGEFERAYEIFKQGYENSGSIPSLVELGDLCYQGKGIQKDTGRAKFLWLMAIKEEPNNVDALRNLVKYEQVFGSNSSVADYSYRLGLALVDKIDESRNETAAALWREEALGIVDRLSSLHAQDLASNLRSKLYRMDSPRKAPAKQSMGTGWFISPKHVVTCNHIISDHENFSINIKGIEEPVPLRLVVSDRQNDIAVLEIIPENIRSKHTLPIASRNSGVGDRVFTIGFPHPDLMGFDPKFTEGSISSTTGIRDDPRTLQISAPVQSGNSGGPLVGPEGSVIGIVTSKLAAARIFEWTGDLPQNVNYAVKIPYLRLLLDTREIPYSTLPANTPVPGRPESIRNTTDAIGIIVAE